MLLVLATGGRAHAQAPDTGSKPSGTPASSDIGALDLQSLLDTPIQSVSRREEKTSSAPAAVFVVTGEDIRRQGFRTVAEVLRSMPGVFLTNDGLYPMVGIRGVKLEGDLDTRLLVLVDGHPMNTQVSLGQSNIERDLPINILAVDRIELIKGPVGSVYGADAYFGVVNIVTRTASGVDVFAAGDADQNTAKGFELAAQGAQKWGDLQASVNLGLYRNHGWDYAFPELVGLDRPTPPGGAVPGTDFLIGQNAYGQLKWKDFTLSGGWGQRIKGLPTAPYSAIVGDTRTNFANRTAYLQLAWDHRFGEVVELLAQASYDDNRYDDDIAYPEPPDDFGKFHDTGLDQWVTGEVRATVTPFKGHRDTVGISVQQHATLMHSFYVALPSAVEDPDNGFGVGPIAKNFGTLNAYAMVEQTFADVLTLQGGLTFYAHGLFGSRFTPKLAAVWQPSPDDTVKAIFAQGFRPPTLYESYFEDGLDFITNPALRPETVTSFEAGYERRIAGFASAGVSVYRNRYDGAITSVTVPAPGLDHPPDPDVPTDFRAQFQNAGGFATLGGDLYFNLRYQKLVSAYGGVAVQQLQENDGSVAQIGFAPVTANLAVSTRALWEPLSLALNAAFVSGRLKDVSGTVIPDDPAEVPPYLLVNASARLDVPWVKGLIVQLSVYNLFDSRIIDNIDADHAPLTQLQQPGRQFRLQLEYQL